MPRLNAWPFLAIALIATCAQAQAQAQGDDPGLRVYREAIEPVLVKSCYGCHSAKAAKLKGGLRLDSREGLLQGGDTGPAVVPGKPAESLLIQAIQHEEGLEMPPKEPRLPQAVIVAFVRWVDAGAPAPSGRLENATSTNPKTHWAFQPVKKPEPPVVNGKNAGWVRTPIDAFVLAKLEARGWSPAPEAPRAEWLRRVTFDLTGLPPTPEEIAAFTADLDPQALETVVDRLLDSPRYGERWAQHWLDVVRFAETEGYEYDRSIPDAWRFRDYVIDALNHDKTFDQFATEQIAGDEQERSPGDLEARTASAFHRLGPVRRNAGNPEIALSRNEVLTERTDIVGAAFLALTVGCARCHNHKLEPISQKDYYRLQAYLAATDEDNQVLATVAERAAWDAETKSIKNQMDRLKSRMKKSAGEERVRLAAELDDLEDKLPPPLATIPATRNDFAHRTEIHVLKRGEWEAKGEAVAPRPPSVLVDDTLPELPADVPDPRTRLARWLVDPAHPLTARVFVNRVWQHHFGAGLVKTVNDFGTKGEKPSHPELLDWLAATFVEGGWRIKPLHRLIVLSATYRQSSRSPSAFEASKLDPANRLYWHVSRRRLTAEEVRDAMLAVSGRLNLKAGGPSVMVPVDPDLTKLLYKPSQWQAAASPTEYDRRSVYLLAKRNLRLPFMEAFDAPALLTSCARRESSTHAPQALELLNGRLSNDLARAFAARLTRETGDDIGKTVDRAFVLALGRPPSESERGRSLAFLRDQPLTEFALAVFNLNGFLYVP